ncbi:hypothetical protein BpHYR1_006772 [Brachionus plicatilis]|uniref:Uncharacterized protein n=1 Tax=Brachionus plicatilis TaxID=10195 RepID=A0A3M7SYB7_BRAPC|nr:hypothetical protein BpHYR1_006772 [Brachionus plicatilis]
MKNWSIFFFALSRGRHSTCSLMTWWSSGSGSVLDKKTPYSHQGMSHILKSNQRVMIHFIIQDNFHEALQKKSPLDARPKNAANFLASGAINRMLLRTRSWFLKILAGFVSSCPESNTKKIHIFLRAISHNALRIIKIICI